MQDRFLKMNPLLLAMHNPPLGVTQSPALGQLFCVTAGSESQSNSQGG